MMTTTNPPPPKRRPYNASGSLSEYGVFPECDAQQAAADCTCPHQDAREPDHDVACPARRTHPAITHCDNCGLDWLDNGLNPVGCPYCKQRELLTLAEQWERDAGGCRRDGYMDAAVVKENCAFRLRQVLGISAIAKALATKQPAAVDVVQVPRELINKLLAALQGRRGDLHFRLAALAAQQQEPTK